MTSPASFASSCLDMTVLAWLALFVRWLTVTAVYLDGLMCSAELRGGYQATWASARSKLPPPGAGLNVVFSSAE